MAVVVPKLRDAVDDRPHTPASCPGALTGGDKKKIHTHSKAKTLFSQPHTMSSTGSTNHNKRLACKSPTVSYELKRK